LFQLLSIFFDNIVPILIVAGVSYLLARQLQMDGRVIGQLVFYLLAPALAFNILYRSEINADEVSGLFFGTVIFQLVILALTFVVLRIQSVPRTAAAAVMISSFCLNAGNYGLSVINFAFGEEVLARAAVVFISNLILNYSLGVFIASSGRNTIRDAFVGVLRVPTIYAIPLAFFFRVFSIELPNTFLRPIELLSDATIPCMLILLGVQLNQAKRITNWRLVSTGVVLKMLVAPLIGLVLAVIFQMPPLSRAGFIPQVSMPSAVVTLIFATEYGLDRDLSLSLILATTLLSPLTLSVILWLVQPV
jgi:malate permease and related proteins